MELNNAEVTGDEVGTPRTANKYGEGLLASALPEHDRLVREAGGKGFNRLGEEGGWMDEWVNSGSLTLFARARAHAKCC